MARESFQIHIKELEQELICMGEMVAMAVNCSIEALKSHNISDAEKIISGDLLINNKRWHIEERCINLIATQQPVASDLRDIIAILSIITDLERMGDHAEGIAKIVIMLGSKPLVKPLIDIPRMAEKAISMLRKSIEAFVKRDTNTAQVICNEDDEVDALYEQVYRELLTYMIEDPKTIKRSTYLLWVAHDLERIADRVTNICERIVFLVAGKMEKINVSKY
ncbi:MAG: phosphate signaling complex protein PhoU [Candidatus Cloacimonetes bacterium]|nr:phosphate signaling complex protein PhoU [Candidatus Cloacimonadota bacterium]